MDVGSVVQASSRGMLTVVDSEIAEEQTGVSSSHTAAKCPQITLIYADKRIDGRLNLSG